MTEETKRVPVPVIRITESMAHGIARIEICISYRDKANRDNPNDWVISYDLNAEQQALHDLGLTAYVSEYSTTMRGTWESHLTQYHAEERDLRRVLPVLSRLNKRLRAARDETRDDSFGASVVALANAIKADRIDWTSGRSTETLNVYGLRDELQRRADAFGRQHGQKQDGTAA